MSPPSTAAARKKRCGKIYDGSFTGTLTDGDGTAAELLCANGIQVFGETRLEQLLEQLRG